MLGKEVAFFLIVRGPEARVCTVVQFSYLHSKETNQLKHQVNEYFLDFFFFF